MKRIFKIILKTVLVLFVLLNIITAFHAWKFTHFYEAGNEAEVKTSKSAWQVTKEIFFGIKAMKKKNTAPGTGFQVINLTTENKTNLEGWYTVGDSAKGTIILFHGHGSNKSGTNAEAAAFQKMGYHTLQMDFRAHGGSGGNTCTIGYNEGEDVKLAYDFIRNKGEKKVVLWGISMGAAAITKSIHDHQLKPEKVILEMPFASILDAAESRIRLMHIPAEPLATLVTFWGGVENGFWAFNIKPSVYAKDITAPVLLQWGKNDPRVSQAETDLIYNNITAPKQLVVYEQSAHESLCKKEKEKWVAAVSAFLP